MKTGFKNTSIGKTLLLLTAGIFAFFPAGAQQGGQKAENEPVKKFVLVDSFSQSAVCMDKISRFSGKALSKLSRDQEVELIETDKSGEYSKIKIAGKQGETIECWVKSNILGDEKLKVEAEGSQTVGAVGAAKLTKGSVGYNLPDIRDIIGDQDDTSQSANGASTADIVATAKGTGRTTGHIATLSILNRTNEPVMATVGPYLIPSSGQYQPYIVPAMPSITVPPGATVHVPLEGFCTDIRRPPVPSGAGMPPVGSWVKPRPLPADWMPLPGNGWMPVEPNPPVVAGIQGIRPAGNMSYLIPGTNIPLGHTIHPDQNPGEVAGILLNALTRIAEAYDSLKSEGAVHTPFSNNEDQERTSVIQQTFWIFTAGLSGRPYKVDDFRKNTIEQFENNTGRDYEAAPQTVRDNIEDGVGDFWSTFQAVGVEAKVLQVNTAAEEVDYDNITQREQLPQPIIPGYDRYSAERALNGASHEKAMKKAFSNEDAQKRWSEVFKRIYGK